MKVYLDGRYLEEEKACVSIDDRGFLYGDALYENVRVYRGGFFRFDEHYRRLARGATALRIEQPTRERLRQIAGRVASINGIDDGAVRMTLTRGRGGEGLRTRGVGPPTLLVSARPISAERMAAARDGWRAILARSRRSAVGLPSSIKSANRLDAILARLEADEAGVEEAILLSADGHVAEGTACNLFWRHGAGLRTPDLGVGILPGVTRGVVLEVADRLGIGVEEGRWPPETLREAPEAFVTMTSLGPVPLTTLDGRPFPGDRDVVPRVRDAYWSLVGEEAARDPIDGG